MASVTRNVDLAVLGAGPGGYAAAFMAADLGLRVALIDEDPNPGGTCLYRGCIPSKALLHVAKVIAEAREAKHWGIRYGAPDIDIETLRSSTQAVVDKMTSGLGQLSRARKITYIQGRGSFRNSTSLTILGAGGSEDHLEFGHAIIATGSTPAIVPSLALDSPAVWDSTDALKLERVPKSLLVIGGGYIGLELSSVYAALGSRVTVVEMLPYLLPGADADLVKPLATRIGKICHEIHLSTQVVKIEKARNGVSVTLDGPEIKKEVQTFERVLISVGRKPNSSDLGLSNTRVQTDGRGFVLVDGQRRTADPKVFAIGDITGQPMLAHKATHEGNVAAEVIAGQKSVFEPRAIPAVVFTDPEVAWCGLTETEAKEKGIPIKVGRFPWAASGRATTVNRNDGLTKVLADPETDAILGVGITGTGAGELIAEGVLAIEMGALASDLHLTIHPHPTLSETLMESAELIFGRSTHLYRSKSGS